MGEVPAVAVSLRRSPQPFQALIFLVAFSAIVWLVLAIAVGGAAANGGMAAFGLVLALVGVSLVLNLNGCADYMRDSIRKDAPYGYDYFRYAIAEGPGGVRVPGISLVVIGTVVAAYATAVLAA